LGTVSLLAGLDLYTGRIIETVSDTHHSADFIAFLKKLDATYRTSKRFACGAGPPFRAYFETDTELLGPDAVAVLIRVHADVLSVKKDLLH
jgi:hypothetical protein